MALKGTLKDFGVADILQLIGQQLKNGVLVLRRKSEEVKIAFFKGAIINVDISSRNRELIGEMMVKAGVISHDQLKIALERQRRTLKRLGDVVADLGYLEHQDVRWFVHLQATEIIYSLFSWREGTYSFETEQVEQESQLPAPLGIESLLMEGLRRVDEWPTLKERAPRVEEVMARVEEMELPRPQAKREQKLSADGPGAFDSLMGELEGDSNAIDEAEICLYDLVDGRRTVQELIYRSRLGEFEAIRSLVALLEGGYIRSLGAASKGKERKRRLGTMVREVATSLVSFVAYGILLAWALALLAKVDFSPLSALWPNPVVLDPGLTVKGTVIQLQLIRLRSILESHKIQNGTFPSSLDDLVRFGFLEERDLTYPYLENPYHYRTKGQGFVLLPPTR